MISACFGAAIDTDALRLAYANNTAPELTEMDAVEPQPEPVCAQPIALRRTTLPLLKSDGRG